MSIALERLRDIYYNLDQEVFSIEEDYDSVNQINRRDLGRLNRLVCEVYDLTQTLNPTDNNLTLQDRCLGIELELRLRNMYLHFDQVSDIKQRSSATQPTQCFPEKNLARWYVEASEEQLCGIIALRFCLFSEEAYEEFRSVSGLDLSLEPLKYPDGILIPPPDGILINPLLIMKSQQWEQ